MRTNVLWGRQCVGGDGRVDLVELFVASLVVCLVSSVEDSREASADDIEVLERCTIPIALWDRTKNINCANRADLKRHPQASGSHWSIQAYS